MSVPCDFRLSPAIGVYQRMCNIHKILNDLSETFNDKLF